MSRRLAPLLASVAFLAGCGHSAAHRPSYTPVSPSTVPAAKWQPVLRDAYDGRLDHRYPCEVVEAALTHLPSSAPVGCEACNALTDYLHKAC